MNTNIELFFPEEAPHASKRQILDDVMGKVERDQRAGYAGFESKENLRQHLGGFLGSNPELYKLISEERRAEIKNTIEQTISECRGHLSAPNISIFIFPWLTQMEELAESLGGVSGVVPSAGIIHLYVIPAEFDYKHLKKATSHEFNHIVFYDNHGFPKETGPIYKSLIFDGLAENFEEYINGDRPIAAKVLNKEESKEVLSEIYPHLETPISFEKGSFYRELFFGGKNYKRWTGYTIGYEIVKSFREDNLDLSWEEIMQKEPKEIFDDSHFVKETKKLSGQLDI